MNGPFWTQYCSTPLMVSMHSKDFLKFRTMKGAKKHMKLIFSDFGRRELFFLWTWKCCFVRTLDMLSSFMIEVRQEGFHFSVPTKELQGYIYFGQFRASKCFWDLEIIYFCGQCYERVFRIYTKFFVRQMFLSRHVEIPRKSNQRG